MKRFLKHDRYELGDLEREQTWQGIRREMNRRTGSRLFRWIDLRPALTVAATVATLAVLGVWWIDSNQADKIQTAHPGLLGEGPETGLPGDMPLERKAPGTEGLDELEMAVIEPATRKALPKGKEEVLWDESQELKMAAAPSAATAPAADAAVEESAVPTEIPPGIPLTGRVMDRKTGQGLAYARLLVRGTNRSVTADSSGVFHLDNLPPGGDITLVILMPGYEPLEQTVAIPALEPFDYAFNLEREKVETTSSFEVAGTTYATGGRGQTTQPQIDPSRLNELDSPVDEIVGKDRKAAREGLMGKVSRSTDVGFVSPAPVIEETRTWGSVTGGTKPPNGEQVELMYFEHTGVNPFVASDDDSLSTFAVDVDNASWTVTRNYLSRGMLPPKDAIRVEEFVNAFDPGWPRQSDDVFRIHGDGALSRFGEGYHLLRVGVVGKSVKDEDRKAANLIFVIDISGSMNRENRLGAVKKSLHILLDELGEGDRVGLVVYGSRGEIRLEPTDISRRQVIVQAIDGLVTNGSTNVHEGLELAYGLARKYYEPAKVNRLILCSDGVANNGGSTEAEEILSLVRKASDEGITISTIGFGMGNYNDVLMEKLADKGDGNYYYVDRQEEAERVFKENLTGLLQTIAREVKVQVEFDPRVVARWRLLGYENRDVADRDFRNDAVDAGEVGAGHQVTALYELKLTHPSADDFSSGSAGAFLDEPAIRVGTVRLRYEAPAHDTARAGQVEEIEQTLLKSQLTRNFDSGTVWMRTQAVAAEFAEILRGSFWAKESRLVDLVPVADGLAAEMAGDPMVRDLADMIRKAADLQSGDPVTPDPDPAEKEE